MSLLDSTIPHWCVRTFGDEITTRVFAPLIADWQRDRAAATTTRRRMARDMSGAAALATTAALVGARLANPSGVPRRDLQSIGLTLVVHAAIGLALGLAPVLLVPIVSGPTRYAFLAWMAPAMSAVSLTVGLLPTAAVIQRRSRHGWTTRAPWLLGGVTIASMVLLLAHVGWLTPFAKQAFRVRSLAATSSNAPLVRPDDAARRRRAEELRANDLPRGVNELTLTELVAHTPPQRVYPQVTTSARRREAALRVVLVTVWPAIFALFGWRLARHRRSLGALGLSGWWALAVVTSLTVSFGGFDSAPRQLSAGATAAVTWLIAAAALGRAVHHREAGAR